MSAPGKAWHSKAITSPGAKEPKDHLVDVEQHAFMLILLKGPGHQRRLNADATNPGGTGEAVPA